LAKGSGRIGYLLALPVGLAIYLLLRIASDAHADSPSATAISNRGSRHAADPRRLCSALSGDLPHLSQDFRNSRLSFDFRVA